MCLERREAVPCFPPPSSSRTKPPAQHQLRLMIHGEPLFGSLLPEHTLARAASRPALLGALSGGHVAAVVPREPLGIDASPLTKALGKYLGQERASLGPNAAIKGWKTS